MVYYRCLNCGDVWDAKGKPVQCPKCRKTDLIREDEFKEIIEQCQKLDPSNPRLRLQVLKAILSVRGLKFKPLATLNLADRVLEDLFPKAPDGMVILEDGRVLFHEIRVKKGKLKRGE